MKQEHWPKSKHLPQNFLLGLDSIEVDPDTVIGLYLYDEGGKVMYVPALYLLQLGNQEDTKLGMMAGEAAFTGFTLGLGGAASGTLVIAEEGAEAANLTGKALWLARGATAVKWADRAVTVLSIASRLINEHRGLIIEKFGDNGGTFLRYWQTVDTVVAIYGLGRGAAALGQTLNGLRKSFKAWREAQARLKSLLAEETAALDEVAMQTEQSMKELEDARAGNAGQTAKRAAGGPAEAPTPSPAGKQAKPKAGTTEGAFDGITSETEALLEAKPQLKKALGDAPRAARALKKCRSPCYPDFATRTQIDRLDRLLEEAEDAGLHYSEGELTNFLRSRDSWEGLERAIDDIDRSLERARGVQAELRSAGTAARGDRSVPAGRPPTSQIRAQPGVASGGEKLPEVTGQWFPQVRDAGKQRGIPGTRDPSAAQIPRQIAKRMRNLGEFKNFDEFREAFWKMVVDDPVLGKGWSKGNVSRMKDGLAPLAPKSQVIGGGSNRVYQLNHKLSLKNGGGLYDMDNIEVVGPNFHANIGD